MLVAVEIEVTAVDGVSRPLFRFRLGDVSKGRSSMLNALAEHDDEREESSSLEASHFTFLLGDSLTGESPL